MNNRIQISVRLEPELMEKFQKKLQQRGLSQTKIITSFIQSFVENEALSLLSETHAGTSPQTLALLLQEIQRLNQQISKLQSRLVKRPIRTKTRPLPRGQKSKGGRRRDIT